MRKIIITILHICMYIVLNLFLICNFFLFLFHKFNVTVIINTYHIIITKKKWIYKYVSKDTLYVTSCMFKYIARITEIFKAYLQKSKKQKIK